MTSQKIFYTAKNDKVFKTILGNEDNKELLKMFLERILKQEIQDLVFLKNELLVNYPKERRKTVDILVKIKGKHILIELNSQQKPYLSVRNFCYFTNIYSKKTEAGKKYTSEEKYILLNLTYGMSKNDKEKRVYKVMDETGKEYVNNIEIIEYNMDKIGNFCYDKDRKKVEEYKHLIMLDSPLEKLEKLSEGDELVKQFKDELKELNENETYTSWITPEQDQEFILNSEKDISFKEGIVEGKKEQQVEIAKTLLEKRINLVEIADITGLSIKELEKIL